MFIGHFAVGMAGKRAAPRVSLPALFVAATFADILWPVLVAGGIETVRIVPGATKFTPLEFASYPWSHSLLMLCIWAIVIGALYRLKTGDARGGVVLGALVVSHWVLDWITHKADMPLYPGGVTYGLGLWNNPRATMAVEVVLFAIGAAIYEGTTKGKNRAGQYSFWFLVILLLAAYAFNSGGAPPPSVKALWMTAIVGLVVTLGLAAFVDRNRTLEDNVRAE